MLSKSAMIIRAVKSFAISRISPLIMITKKFIKVMAIIASVYKKPGKKANL